MFSHRNPHPPALLPKSCLVEQSRSIYLHDRKRHMQMICFDKIHPGGMQSYALHPTGKLTLLKATFWLQQHFTVMFHCGPAPPNNLKSPPHQKRKQEKTFLCAFLHAFKPQTQTTLIFKSFTKTCTVTQSQWN